MLSKSALYFEKNEELDTLNEAQVNAALELVDKRHPLVGTPLTKALPYLRVFTLFDCCFNTLEQRRQSGRLSSSLRNSTADSF